MENDLFVVIVAGSRGFNNYEMLRRKLDALLVNIPQHKIKIRSGTARGADELGEQYANERGYALDRYAANWNLYGKSAGYIRNKQMAEDNAHALVAFWDGKSRGTKHMIDIAKEKGLHVRVIRY